MLAMLNYIQPILMLIHRYSCSHKINIEVSHESNVVCRTKDSRDISISLVDHITYLPSLWTLETLESINVQMLGK